MPKVVGIEKAREFRIDIDDVDIALSTVSDNRLVIVPSVVCFDVNAEGSIHFETQSVEFRVSRRWKSRMFREYLHGSIVGLPFPAHSLVAFHTLCFELCQTLL